MNGQIISFGIAAGVVVALLGWRIWRLFKPGNSLLDRPVVFFFLVFAAILVMRLPQILWAREINPDESQMVTQAFRYLAHPVPWRDVDGTTAGPLDSWFLSVPILLGAPANWVTARTVFWAAECATLIFIYLALRCFGTSADAQFALMPTIFFYAFVTNGNFTYYSSETLPVLLIAVEVWLLCRAWAAGSFTAAGGFFVGLLAGCLPFAKLQVAPMAALLLAGGVAVILFGQPKDRGRKIALMVFGAVVFPTVLLGVVAACGASGDFWKSYVLAPSAYAGESLGTKVATLWRLFMRGLDFRSYFASAVAAVVLFAAAWCHARQPRLEKKLWTALMGVFGLGVAAIFCVMMGGKGYGHYLLLLIPAQAVLAGLAFLAGKSVLIADETDPKAFPRPIHWFMAAFAIAAAFQIGKAPEYFNMMRPVIAQWSPVRKSFVARRVMKASRPGDTLSVWGWMPSYYVETGLMPASRDAIGHFLIEDGPYRNYYRERYVGDLARNPPALFVDAMADGVFNWTRPDYKQHEYFPALKKFIDDNYSLWVSVHIIFAGDAPGIPVRIYVRKERMAELHLAPEELNISADPSLAPE